MNYGQNQPGNNYGWQNQPVVPPQGVPQNTPQPNQGYQPGMTGYQQPVQPLYRGGYSPSAQRPAQQQNPGYGWQNQPPQQYQYPPQQQYNPNGGFPPNQSGRPYPTNSNPGGCTPGMTPGYNPADQYQPIGQQNGYQEPRQQKQPKKPFDIDRLLSILLYAVLPALFAAVLLMSRLNFIKAVVIGVCMLFLAATAGTLFLIWRRGRVHRNTLMTALIVYLALAVVAAVAAFTMKNTPARRTQSTQSSQQQAAAQNQTQQSNAGNGYTDQQIVIEYTDAPAMVTPAPTKDPLDSDAVRQMQSFFYFWSVNKQEEMLKLCSPSWINSLSSANKPANELYKILANRTPVDYTADKITGTDNDNSRTITVTATIDKNRGTAPATYRFSIIMTKEDGQWYVDPRSLSSSVQETEAPTAEPTSTPEPEEEADPNTVLYYNPGKGSFYHLDPNCVSTAAKYRPLQGTFRYSQVNESAYADLQPCNMCKAPLRPFEFLE